MMEQNAKRWEVADWIPRFQNSGPEEHFSQTLALQNHPVPVKTSAESKDVEVTRCINSNNCMEAEEFNVNETHGSQLAKQNHHREVHSNRLLRRVAKKLGKLDEKSQNSPPPTKRQKLEAGYVRKVHLDNFSFDSLASAIYCIFV
ncbi:hypothetical protein TB1_001862 [Malus domestica]